MTSKHTPGPWRLGKAGPNMCPTVGTHKGLMVAMVVHGDNHPTQANALLIAAAPDMLEALQGFCRRVECGEVRSIKTYEKFKAVIAKATGE